MENADDKRKFIRALIVALLSIGLPLVVKLAESFLQADFYEWGVYPQTLHGLKGILLAPLVHGDAHHLYNNVIPLFLLTLALFYFYGKLGYPVFLFSWVLPGLWVWVGARHSYHIGASGVVYSLAAFLFLSGIIRKHTPLIAISLIVVFLYGSMIWYIFPIDYDISWESHLFGSVAGVFLAIYYVYQGPQRQRYSWEDEENEEEGIWTVEEENQEQENRIP